MKLNKFILSTAIAAGLISAATAADNTATIDITGSTAFRSSVYTAIQAVLTGETYAYVGGSLGSAGQAIFKGNLNGTPVVVRTSFSGSAEGVRDVTSGANVSFLPVGQTTTVGGTANATAGTDPASPDLAFSDVYQSSTNFQSPTLDDAIVAVVPFKFVVSKGGGAAGVTNMDNQKFRTLYANGFFPLSVYTGNQADQGVSIFASGRDSGSGTRVTTLAETGFGINREVAQFTGTVAGGIVTSLDFVGNSGYTSGGLLVALLAADATSQGGYVMGYVGLTDAASAITGGASELSYNGTAYSPTAVYEGKYTFWGYEHLFALSANPGNNVGALRTALGASLASNPGAAGLNPANMHVARETDGADVQPTF
jgi:hypothetical protein